MKTAEEMPGGRDAIGVREGWGEHIPFQQTRGLGERPDAPPAGSGAEPRPKTILVVFKPAHAECLLFALFAVN